MCIMPVKYALPIRIREKNPPRQLSFTLFSRLLKLVRTLSFQRINCTFLCFIFLLLPFPNYSDSVLLKNGKEIQNVKTTIDKTSVRIKYESGKLDVLNKSEIKSLKILVVNWKTPKPILKEDGLRTDNSQTKNDSISETNTDSDADTNKDGDSSEDELEKIRVAEASEKGDEFIPRPEEEIISPWGNFARGLIPGYSGLYRTQDTKTAITFSTLEIAVLMYALDLHTATKQRVGYGSSYPGGFFLYGVDANNNPANAQYPAQAFFLFSYVTESRFYGYEGGLTGKDYVSPNIYQAARRDLTEQRSASLIGLAFLLGADAISSYFAADSWNEGTFSGSTSQEYVKSTKPSSRLIRSAFLPGWGQVYGGDKAKGYGWMVGGILLFSNAIRSETQVIEARGNYQRNDVSQNLNFVLPFFSDNGTLSSGEKLQRNLFLSYLASEPKFDALETAVKERNQAWSMYGAFLLLNGIDSYFFSGASGSGSLSILPRFEYMSVLGVGSQSKWESVLSIDMSYRY